MRKNEIGGDEKRVRLRVADVLLILLALAAALTATFYVRHRMKITEGAREIRCIVHISSVDLSLAEANGGELIKLGDIVLNENGTVRLGEVMGVTLLPHKRAGVREGEVTWIEDDSKIDVEVEVRMKGALKDGEGIRVKALRIAAGGRGSFRFGSYYATEAQIVWVEAT